MRDSVTLLADLVEQQQIPGGEERPASNKIVVNCPHEEGVEKLNLQSSEFERRLLVLETAYEEVAKKQALYSKALRKLDENFKIAMNAIADVLETTNREKYL